VRQDVLAVLQTVDSASASPFDDLVGLLYDDFDPLRDHPRFRRLLHRLGLEQA
jgi:hypothetical protein